MSRKRGKDKRAGKSKAEAVPEEVLAEGSGPNEVVDANAQSLADAASEALGAEPDSPPPVEEISSPKKRGRKSKKATDAWGQPIEVEVVDEPERPVAVEASASDDALSEDSGSDDSASEDSGSDDSGSDDSGSDDELLASDDEPGEPTEEQQSEQSLEDAVMRAEAEAELGESEEPADASEAEVELVADGDAAAAALPTTAASMDQAQLKNLVEALVFAADKPVTLLRLRQLTRVSDVKRLEQALADIAADFANRGIALQQVSGGYQFRTNTQYSVWVQQLIAGRPVRLSRAQLETLAIVAYRQPITRPEVDEIRGVDSSATLRLLLDRSLIRVLGKKEDVGRPTLYGTTKEFLDFFSLGDLRELPTLREYSELTAESRKVMSDRLGIDPEGNVVGDAPAAADGAAAEGEAVEAADGEAVEAAGVESPIDAVEAAGVDASEDEAVEAAGVDAADGEAVEAAGVDASEGEAVEAAGVDAADGEAVEAAGVDAADGEVVEAAGVDAADGEAVEAAGVDGADGEGVEAATGDALDVDSETVQATVVDAVDVAHRDVVQAAGDADGESVEAAGVEVADGDAVEAAEVEVVEAVAAEAEAAVAESALESEMLEAGDSSNEDAMSFEDEDAAAIAAVSAVTNVIGIVDADGSIVNVREASAIAAEDEREAELDAAGETGTSSAKMSDQGAPRGAPQADVIATSADESDDADTNDASDIRDVPDELRTAAERSESDASLDSDAHVGAEGTSLRAGEAGERAQAGEGDSEEPSDVPSPEAIDASAPESLDETDKPPAD